MLRGVRQLKELVIRYSDIDGSSKGVREYLRNNILDFANKNPELIIKTVKKRSSHPVLRGSYGELHFLFIFLFLCLFLLLFAANGNVKVIGIKNISPEEIHSFVLDLRNQVGKKVNISIYYITFE